MTKNPPALEDFFYSTFTAVPKFDTPLGLGHTASEI